jgi:hypothetical protein
VRQGNKNPRWIFSGMAQKTALTLTQKVVIDKNIHLIAR